MHDFNLSIGPHSAIIDEPSCLRVKIDNNKIVEANLRLGYVHKGVEKLLEGKKIEQGLHIVDHICGICSVAHPSCYVRVIEKMLNFEPSPRVNYIRTLVSELGRIQSHIFGVGFMLHEIGLETMLAYSLRERELVLEILERLTGSRTHFAIHKVRTVRNDINDDDIRFIWEKITQLEKKMPSYVKTIGTNKVKTRLVDSGIIPKSIAKDYSLVGPIARGSGIFVDVRKDDPYEAYKEIDFNIITEKNGDAYARMLVRLNEIIESIKIVKQVLKNMPEGQIQEFPAVIIEEGMEAGRVEAPRGENFHMIKIKYRKLDRVRIRPPTFNFMTVFTKLLEGKEVSEVPVILASLDPCYACLERVVMIKDGKSKVLTEDEFKHKYR